jgi:hypothetical protein
MFEKDNISLYEEKGRFFFCSYYFKIYLDRVEAYFATHRQMIPISEIESVELVKKIPKWIGRGLRYGRKGAKYFAIRNEGIRLILSKGRWTRIFLSVKEPKHVKLILEERMEQLDPILKNDAITRAV